MPPRCRAAAARRASRSRTSSKAARKRRRARCSRPRAVTVRHPRTDAISAADSPSHSERSRTSRSRGPRSSSASCTSDSSPVVGRSRDADAASCASRSWSALRRRLDLAGSRSRAAPSRTTTRARTPGRRARPPDGARPSGRRPRRHPARRSRRRRASRNTRPRPGRARRTARRNAPGSRCCVRSHADLLPDVGDWSSTPYVSGSARIVRSGGLGEPVGERADARAELVRPADREETAEPSQHVRRPLERVGTHPQNRLPVLVRRARRASPARAEGPRRAASRA